jgi:hypothetical protein
MKRLILIGVLALIANAAFSQTASEYSIQKTQAFMQENVKEEGLFRYAFFALPVDSLVISWYPTWAEKRYSKDRMIAEAKKLAEQAKGTLNAALAIAFTGDFTSEGRIEVRIPKDFAEYVFVENESGTYLPCVKAEGPLMGGAVNATNKTAIIALQFGVTEALYKNAETMIFTIGGLGLQDKTFTYQLPWSSHFQDCPAEIRDVLVRSGIWK